MSSAGGDGARRGRGTPAGSAVARRVDVLPAEHGNQTAVVGGLEAAVAAEFAWIPEAAEEQVPKWEVAIVVGVQAAPVMHAVRLRTLDEVADPLRSADVP